MRAPRRSSAATSTDRRGDEVFLGQHSGQDQNHDADRNNEKNRSRVLPIVSFTGHPSQGHLLARKNRRARASRRNDALRQGASGMGWSYLLHAGYAYDPYA